MQNNSKANPISIEQFAAFLDGNLPETEMQAVASAIDGNSDLTAILGEVMSVDETIAPLDGTTDFFAEETLSDEDDFILPDIPAAAADTVEVVSVEPEATVVKEAEHPDEVQWAAAEAPEATPEEFTPQPETFSEGMDIPTAPETEDFPDFGGEF
ncbi:MAG: hypothetical protein ACI3YC_01290 [Alloprevotella sp.]